MLRNKGGFTLIELVMIIVILGILAAVAIPKYQDLTQDARKANAKGVIGGLNSAASVAFAKALIDGTTPARCDGGVTGVIDTAEELASCMDGGLSAEWTTPGGGDNFVYTPVTGTTYTFPMTEETGTAKARVRTTADGSGWPN
ncbi:MAG: prepilin-type N-terminal cleavage/methylation domain-containing protein [Thermodesulfovibrionales bacterium]